MFSKYKIFISSSKHNNTDIFHDKSAEVLGIKFNVAETRNCYNILLFIKMHQYE